jgi:hypothetical protein
MRKLNNNYFDKSAVAFLNEPRVAQAIDNNLAEAISKNQIQFEDAEFYLKKNIKGLSGYQKLADETTDKKDGTINFDKSKLPPKEGLILQGIAVNFVSHSSITDPALVPTMTPVLSYTDPAVANADLVIKQEGRTLFTRNIARLMQQAKGDDPQGSGRCLFELANYRYIKPDVTIEIALQFPSGQTVNNSAQQHIEVVLLGTKTRMK